MLLLWTGDECSTLVLMYTLICFSPTSCIRTLFCFSSINILFFFFLHAHHTTQWFIFTANLKTHLVNCVCFIFFLHSFLGAGNLDDALYLIQLNKMQDTFWHHFPLFVLLLITFYSKILQFVLANEFVYSFIHASHSVNREVLCIQRVLDTAYRWEYSSMPNSWHTGYFWL